MPEIMPDHAYHSIYAIKFKAFCRDLFSINAKCLYRCIYIKLLHIVKFKNTIVLVYILEIGGLTDDRQVLLKKSEIKR